MTLQVDYFEKIYSVYFKYSIIYLFHFHFNPNPLHPTNKTYGCLNGCLSIINISKDTEYLAFLYIKLIDFLNI